MRMGVASAKGNGVEGSWDSGMRWIAIALIAAGLVACKTPSQRERLPEGAPRPGRIAALRGPGPPTRVIMITVAGLTASDFLAADGYVATEGDRVRMPNVARLAREGVVGEHALPPSPGLLTSVRSKTN